MPTEAELLSLSYTGSSAFARGLYVEDFRREYLQHGESVRWFKSYQTSRNDMRTNAYQRNIGIGATSGTSSGDSGLKWEEQTIALNGEPLSEVRVLVYQAQETVANGSFGGVTRSTTNIGVIPDEIKLSRGDRIILTSPARVMLEQDVMKRDVATSDTLHLFPVAAIKRVWNETTVYVAGVDYAQSGNSIVWLPGGNAPTSSTRYSIEYTRHPIYEVRGDTEQLIRPDVNGNGLPQRVEIALLNDLSDFEI